MIIILSNFFLFLFLIFSHGYLFLKKILKISNKKNFFEISLIGFIITIFVAQFINFFSPLNDVIIYINLILVFLFLIPNRNDILKNLKINFVIFSISFIIISLNIYGSSFSDDIDHYHYGFILNSDSTNYIWGYSFLNLLYGTSPSWLSLHAYLNLDYSRLQDIHLINGLIFFLILGLLLEEFQLKKSLHIYSPFLFIILIFLLLKYTRIKEFGIDRPATILFCFIIFYYFKYFFNNKKVNLNDFIILSLISISIVSIKIIYFPIIFLPIIILIKFNSELNMKNIKYLILVIPLIILFIKNLLVTGCIIFPIEKSCINSIPWSNNFGAKELAFLGEFFNKSWTSYPGDLSKFEYTKNFNWLATWYERGKSEILEYFFTIVLIIILGAFSFNITNKKNQNLKKKFNLINYFITFLIITSIYIFFSKNPVIRMNHPTMISIMFLFSIFFFNFDPKKFKPNIIYSFILIALLFNSVKNIDRIIDKKFVNNPNLEIINKISKPQKKKLQNFTYYKGWHGKSPIGNRELTNKKHKKFLIFDIIYNEK